MTSLPSFVELLSSLGLSDDTTTEQRRKHHTHGRTSSWGSSSSNASETARPSPHSPTERTVPEIRLSGRQQPGSMSKTHRFSPYLSSAALNRRGSLPLLTVPTLIDLRAPSPDPPTSHASQRRRSGSLPSSPGSPPTSSIPMRRKLAPTKRLSISVEKAQSPPICALLRKSPTSSTGMSPTPRSADNRSPNTLPMSLPTLPQVPYTASIRSSPNRFGMPPSAGRTSESNGKPRNHSRSTRSPPRTSSPMQIIGEM